MDVIADPRTCTEAELLRNVVDIATRFGWKAVHFAGNLHGKAWYDAAGFPDLLLIHPERGLIQFAELKSETGTLSKPQIRWERLLKQASLPYHLWRPSDYPDAVQMLSFGKAVVQ